MDLTSSFKQKVNDILGKYGYRVERIVDYGDHQVNVFDLALRTLNPEDPEFFFVQVGAHDGRRGDPIHHLVQRYHWRGILLEPQPDVFKALERNYQNEPQLVLHNAALAPQDGIRSLYTVEGASLRSSFDPVALRRHFGNARSVKEIRVQAVTFQTLMARYGMERVDLAVIDTEGFDYQVVQLALAAGLRPRMIRYEHLHLTTPDRKLPRQVDSAKGD